VPPLRVQVEGAVNVPVPAVKPAVPDTLELKVTVPVGDAPDTTAVHTVFFPAKTEGGLHPT